LKPVINSKSNKSLNLLNPGYFPYAFAAAPPTTFCPLSPKLPCCRFLKNPCLNSKEVGRAKRDSLGSEIALAFKIQ
jgi:hypothetical protein